MDLDNFKDYSNYRRRYQGYKLKENGYSVPAEAHFSRDLTKIEESTKLKTSGEIMKRREREKNLKFVLYIAHLKSEVLECLFVNRT